MPESASPTMSVPTLCHAFARSVAEGGDAIALRTADGSQAISWQEYDRRVRRIAAGLAALGVGKGDTVGLLLTNRPEFNLVDTAAMHLGAVAFSVYTTSAAEQVAYLFAHAENRVVVCEAQFLSMVREVAVGSAVEHIVCVDADVPSALTLQDLEGAGSDDFDFEASWRGVDGDDVVTLIYTSGTTGAPKGVELTHANVLYALEAATSITGPLTGGRSVSYLPDAHLVNRLVGHYAVLAYRLTVTTVADPKTLLGVLGDVQPTLFLAVPMLWYKIKTALEASVTEQQGVKGRLASWALDVGQRKARSEVGDGSWSRLDSVQHAVADRLVLSKVRRKLGMAELDVAVSGAAPIAEEALVFILGLGIRVSEGWGMSETTAMTTLNPPNAVRVGTVGLPAPGTEVQVAEDGELLVRGPGVMGGYRNDPTRTAEAVDADGWMHTGDIGSIDEDGYVRILDRKKELIINSAGKNMSPSNIENALVVACPLVGSAVAIGDNRPFVTALIALDADAATAYAAEHGLEPSAAVLAEDAGVRAAVAAGVEAANGRLSRVEHIRAWQVLPTFWAPGGDELTPTSKLRRKPIGAKYATEIEALYSR